MPPRAVSRTADTAVVRRSAVTTSGPAPERRAASCRISAGTSAQRVKISSRPRRECNESWCILLRSKKIFNNADICISLVPDDSELDGCQTGGRAVWEGQCQCHRQSQQHLHALCCSRGHEDMCGGERTRVEQCPHIGMSCSWRLISWISQPYFFQQSLSLKVSDQFLQQECLFCVWLLPDLSRHSAFAWKAFIVFAFARKYAFWSKGKWNVASCFSLSTSWHVWPSSGFPLTFLEFIYFPSYVPFSCWFRAKQTFSSRMRKS